MKTVTNKLRKIELISSMVILLAAAPGMGANYTIVGETYDPTPAYPFGGWQDGVIQNLSRQYVNQGVGGSMALQTSATLPIQADYCDAATQIYQSGSMGGNELATRQNTVLSFDLKIDQPGMLSVIVFLDGFAGFDWVGPRTCSVGRIPIRYQPGVFQRIVLALDDPRLGQDGTGAPQFDPASRTWNNIALIVDQYSFAALPASFKVTVDNVQVTTKNPMVPFAGAGAASWTVGSDAYVGTEIGVAEHIGNYKATFTVPFDFSPGTAEIIVANGDKLWGAFVWGGYNLEYCVQIQGGTGRFAGATGSYRGSVNWDPELPTYTATLLGGLPAVGSNP